MEFSITKTWDDHQLNHRPINIKLDTESNDLVININAPFFADPEKPNKEPGDVFNLWDYEGKS